MSRIDPDLLKKQAVFTHDLISRLQLFGFGPDEAAGVLCASMVYAACLSNDARGLLSDMIERLQEFEESSQLEIINQQLTEVINGL